MTETALLSLQIKRNFEATPSELFQAWTHPELLKKWFKSDRQAATTGAVVDLNVGGKYQIDMRLGDNVYPHYGVYETVQPYRKLVFTWHPHGVGSVTRAT